MDRVSGAALADGDFRTSVENRGVVELLPRRRIEHHINERLVEARRAADWNEVTVVAGIDADDIDTTAAWIDHGQSRLHVRCRAARGRGFHVEDQCLTTGVAEAHLQLALNGEQTELVRNICEEEHNHRAGGNLREVRIQLRAEADLVGGEIQLTAD